MTWEFYHTTNNPTGLDSTVGGVRTSELVDGDLNELFAYVSAPPSGVTTEAFQYRKVHLLNAGTVTLTGVRVWMDAMEHSDQIYVGLENVSGQTASTATGAAPTSVTFSQPANYTGGLSLGTYLVQGHTGLWIRQGLSGISEPDPYATVRLHIGGLE